MIGYTTDLVSTCLLLQGRSQCRIWKRRTEHVSLLWRWEWKGAGV